MQARESLTRGLSKRAGRDGSWELDFVETASCILGIHLTGAIPLYPSLFYEIKSTFSGVGSLEVGIQLRSELREKLEP